MNGDPYDNNGYSLTNVRKLPVVKRESKSWENTRKISRMGGYNPAIKVCPVQVAAATLEKAESGRIASIFVSIVWQDGTLACDWSQMPRSQLISHAFNAQATVQDEVHKP